MSSYLIFFPEISLMKQINNILPATKHLLNFESHFGYDGKTREIFKQPFPNNMDEGKTLVLLFEL